MAGVLFFVRGVFLAGLVGLSGLSIAAFLGFASPLL
ncbi:hypothetical protein MNBD_ALPHA12-1592, partial [hydrothermal vent metagenome]